MRGACQVVIASPGHLFLAYLVTEISDQAAELVCARRYNNIRTVSLLTVESPSSLHVTSGLRKVTRLVR